MLSSTLEIIHFNKNLIENVPDNLFHSFKQLKEIKLEKNPLKEPPMLSVCIDSHLKRNQYIDNMKENNLLSLKNKPNSTFLISSPKVNRNDALYERKLSLDRTNSNINLSLPHFLLNNNYNLKPLQNYMLKYKNREGI